MKYYLILITSIRSLFSNKMRSFLTLLGIIIGVAAVLMMISIGTSASSAVTSSIKGLGSNLIFVFSTPNASTSKQIGFGEVEAILRIPHVRRVLPQVNIGATVSYFANSIETQVIGTKPEYEEMRNSHPLYGRFITDADLSSSAKVAVIGSNAASELFRNEVPLGKIVRINGIPFTVVGVLEPKGSQSIGYNPDDMIIIPLTTAQQRLLGANKIDMLSVEVDSEELVLSVKNNITELLNQRFNVKKEEDEPFRILTQEELISTASQVTGILTVLLAGIASISLIVGGIGIMNIMLVSVTERTREIGIRKAVGARKADILLQFLIESVILCVAGGLIGIFLGFLGSYIVADFGGWTPVVSLPTLLLSFGFAVFIGLFFGLYPAYRAASLNPIEALRYE